MGTRSLLAVAFAMVAAVGGCDLGSDGDEPRGERPRAARAPSGDASSSLVDRLRGGGYVLTFRHAATDFSMADETRDVRQLRDCARQRNLSAAGRRQSRTIGSALRRLGVPIGQVLASPYCRTRDTARLAFGAPRSSTALLSGRYLASRTARERQPARLRRLLAAPPRRGTNTVLVSHAFAIDDATGVSLAEGEVAVVAPSKRPRGFDIAATVEADEWARLAGRSRAPRAEVREYRVFQGAGPHDVAPAHDGTVWFTAQAAGELGRLDPRTGRSQRVPLGVGSAPHGVIVGPARAGARPGVRGELCARQVVGERRAGVLGRPRTERPEFRRLLDHPRDTARHSAGAPATNRRLNVGLTCLLSGRALLHTECGSPADSMDPAVPGANRFAELLRCRAVVHASPPGAAWRTDRAPPPPLSHPTSSRRGTGPIVPGAVTQGQL